MLRVVLLSIFCISAVWAHKINLFAYDENNTLYLQSYFTKSSPCKQCPIKLLGSNEQELGTLMSDDEGKASMKLPAAAFSIVVDAGMGHQQKIDYRAQSHTKEDAIESYYNDEDAWFTSFGERVYPIGMLTD